MNTCPQLLVFNTIPSMLLILIGLLFLSGAKPKTLDICNDSCATEQELDLTKVTEDVIFEACPGHLVKLQFRPDDDVDVDLKLKDSDRTIYFTNSLKKSEDVVVYSLTNSSLLHYYFTNEPTPAPIITTTTTESTLVPTPPPVTTTTTTTTTESPANICDTVCEGLRPGQVPVENSCCIDGAVHDCYCMGDGNEHFPLPSCPVGQGYCRRDEKCIETSQCTEDTTCCQTVDSFRYNAKSSRKVSIRYSCQAYKMESEAFEYGSDEVEEPLEQNTVLSYDLTSENIHNIDVNLTLTSPIAGFAAVSIGNGMYAFGYGNLNLSILNTESNKTEVKVVTLNSPMNGDKMVLTYDLGEQSSSTSTTERIVTTTTPTTDKTATVFVLAINEKNFVENHFDEFKIRTWQIMVDACSDLLNIENLIIYNTPYSCRKSCFMTKDPERGCAMLGMHLENIPAATHCAKIEGQTRIQYFREQLESQSKAMKKAYSAGRVAIDSCTAINWTTEWLWVAIGLVVGAVFLAIAIMFVKKQSGRMRKSDMDDSSPIMGDMEPERQMPTSRSNRAFDIINEDDYE